MWRDIEGFEFYKLFTVQVPKLYLWTPDILVWNSANDKRLFKLKNDSILVVNYTGTVSGQISTMLNTECQMSMKRYAMRQSYPPIPINYLVNEILINSGEGVEF